MNRLFVALATAAALLLLGASLTFAQAPPKATAAEEAREASDAAWPAYPITGPVTRGPGWYLAWWKVLLVVVVVLLWVKTTDWASRDTVAIGLPYEVWNLVVFLPLLVMFFLFFFIPFFWLGYPLLWLTYIVPLGIYISKRNSLVSQADKVLTREHIGHVIANLGKGMGANVSTEKKMPHEKGAPVTLSAAGAANEQKNQTNLIEARQSPAYLTLKEMIAAALDRRADKILLDYTADTVNIKHQIDGAWQDIPQATIEGWTKLSRQRGIDVRSQPRPYFDPVTEAMKKLANLKSADRRSKQEGVFPAEYKAAKYMCSLISQGTPTGERVILTIAGKGKKFTSLEDLGMREKMREQLKELLASRKGIIIFSALPQGGLSHTMQFALKSTDRLLRDFVAIGEKIKHEPEVENIEIVSFDSAANESAMTVLPKTILRQPDVLVIRELADAETLKTLIVQSQDEHPKLSITTLRAKDAVETVVRLLSLRVPPAEVAPHLLAVVNQRLIRKLCDKCKEGYEPGDALLAKLGIPAGRVEQLFRERQPLPPDSREKRVPCEQCGDLGFLGRTSIFELLAVNDKFREAMIKDPKLETLKKVARASGHRGLQEEGIALVALGITSLAELQRVLKQ